MPIVFSDVAAASLRAATPSVCERPDGRTVEVIAKFPVGCEQNETSLAREVIARTAFGMKPRQQRRPLMSHENSAEKLVYMANQIRRFFASQGEGVAVRLSGGQRSTLRSFGTPACERRRYAISRQAVMTSIPSPACSRRAPEFIEANRFPETLKSLVVSPRERRGSGEH
jgi:hypothetical protein